MGKCHMSSSHAAVILARLNPAQMGSAYVLKWAWHKGADLSPVLESINLRPSRAYKCVRFSEICSFSCCLRCSVSSQLFYTLSILAMVQGLDFTHTHRRAYHVTTLFMPARMKENNRSYTYNFVCPSGSSVQHTYTI